MAYLVIELNLPGLSVKELNAKAMSSDHKHGNITDVVNLLTAVASGAQNATVQITTKDVSASVASSGAGAKQKTHG